MSLQYATLSRERERKEAGGGEGERGGEEVRGERIWGIGLLVLHGPNVQPSS